MVQRHWKAVFVVTAVMLACGEVVTPPRSDGGSTDGGIADGGLDAGSAGGAGGGAADAGCQCPTGQVCLTGGGCGQCELDSQCPSARPACDFANHECVVCRSSPDSCGVGLYCENETCVPGCGDGSDCASGVCLPTHDCQQCRGDAECAGGRLCGTGTCQAPCSGACGAGWTCCGGRCVDVARDPDHCGVCTRVCEPGSFCARSACQPALLSSVCALPVATALLDGNDDWSGLQVAGALEVTCPPTVVSRSADQDDAGLLGPTGEPLVPGELLCVAGGAFHQRVVGWLEQHGAPVVDSSTAAIYRYSGSDGGVLTQGPLSSITATHDVFVVQFVRAASGAPVLNVAGYYSPGTSAAAWYFINVLLPARATLTGQWIVVDWVDTNVNGQPDAADTWTVMAADP